MAGRLSRCFCNSSRERRPFWAPTYCTTDIEFTGPQVNASAGVLPRAIAAVKVEAKASPAPVRSTGSLGSGYIGMCQAWSFWSKFFERTEEGRNVLFVSAKYFLSLFFVAEEDFSHGVHIF